MDKAKRVIIIVLDGVGIGEAPDAHLYGDQGSNTLANTALAVGGLHLPNLASLGLGNIAPIQGVPPASSPQAMYGKMQERSPGKDTTTGHWEISGVILDKPFPTFPNGFPHEVIRAFEARIGRGTIGNKVASGTVIIDELGPEHLASGDLIVYTSADSVFQIAAHNDRIPEEELYAICLEARQLLQGENGVARVIARPFAGEPGNFWRTTGRKDFSLPPPEETLLDAVKAARLGVYAVGKIEDIFAGRGVTHAIHTKNNTEGINVTLRLLDDVNESGLIFVNLVEFDMLYGHRNNPQGFANALIEFDAALPAILSKLGADDMLVITGDHGCDPTTPSTDHSREFVPLLVAGGQARPGVNLGIRNTFADVSATARHLLGLPVGNVGECFL